MSECKLIDNTAKRQIAFYNFLIVFCVFCVFGSPLMYNLTYPILHSYSSGLAGLFTHALLAALVSGFITYISMPSGDRKSCKVD